MVVSSGLSYGGRVHSEESLSRGTGGTSGTPPPCLPQSSGRHQGDGFLPGCARPALGVTET